jgi:glycosyltransferase involved in cell wall biosynthesis
MVTKEKNLIAIIPAYNAETTLELVVQGLNQALPEITTVVIDDGSTDQTRAVSEACGCLCIRHDKNRGKGAALKTGFIYALQNGFDIVLTLDADGQHKPEQASSLLDKMLSTGADLTIGSRMHSTKVMPIHRVISNHLTTFLLTLRTGQKIADSQSGFRMHSAQLLRAVIDDLATERFEFESELLIRSIRKGYKISAVDVDTIYSDEKSSMQLKDVIRFIHMFWRSKRW